MAILTKRNWKKLGKQHLPEIVFFAVTIISAGTLIVPLWNYTQLYSALYNFSYTILGVNINTSQLNAHTAQINFTLIATNPTGYSGLQISGVNCIIDYNGTVHLGPEGITSSWELTELFVTKTYPIDPNSNRTILFDTTINNQQFITYLMTQIPGGQIQWFLTVDLSLTSVMVNIPITQYFTPVTPLS